MQRAINVLTIEKFLTKNRIEIYFRYVRENASPEFVPTSTEMTGGREAGKSNEQFHKDFKTSHNTLMDRFSRRVGKGKISAFDALLQDVEKLKTLHNETVHLSFIHCRYFIVLALDPTFVAEFFSTIDLSDCPSRFCR